MGAYKGTQTNTIQGGSETEVIATDSNIDYNKGETVVNDSAGAMLGETVVDGNSNVITVNKSNITDNVIDMVNNAVESSANAFDKMTDKLGGFMGDLLGLNSDKDKQLANNYGMTLEYIKESNNNVNDVVDNANNNMRAVYNAVMTDQTDTTRIDLNGLIKSTLILGGTGLLIWGLKGAFKRG